MYIHLIVPYDLWTVLIPNVIHDHDDVFIIKYFINPSMKYLIPIWWPSVSKIV